MPFTIKEYLIYNEEEILNPDLSRWWNTSAVRYYRRRILREYVSSSGSAPQNKKNHKIWKRAKTRNWQRATRLCLRQSLCQFQRMFPDFYFSKFYFEVAASANTSPQKHFRKNLVWYIDHPRQSDLRSAYWEDTSVLQTASGYNVVRLFFYLSTIRDKKVVAKIEHASKYRNNAQ